MATVSLPSEAQTIEKFVTGLEITQLVLFPDGEILHIFLFPTGEYERTTILTVQCTDDGLELGLIGPDVPESPYRTA